MNWKKFQDPQSCQTEATGYLACESWQQSLSFWLIQTVWLVMHVYESPGVGRAADSGLGEDWFEPFLCCHLIFLDMKLPLSSQFFYFVFIDSILQGAKLWWTTYSIPFWWGWGMVRGKTPLVLHAPRMKISSCCVSALACFKYLYIVMECWVKNW